MKAKIYYRRPDSTLPHNKWKYTVKTIEVSKNEPNHILQEFIKITRLVCLQPARTRIVKGA